MRYHYFTLEQRANLERAIRSLDDDAGKTGLLDRLHDSDYGLCRKCGADIAYVLLLENPRVNLCRDCARE